MARPPSPPGRAAPFQSQPPPLRVFPCRRIRKKLRNESNSSCLTTCHFKALALTLPILMGDKESVRPGINQPCLLSLDLDDLTSGALLCHYRLSKHSCCMFLLSMYPELGVLPFLPHLGPAYHYNASRLDGQRRDQLKLTMYPE